MSATKFTSHDRIAWSHVVAPKHEEGNTVRASAVSADDAKARFGTVLGNHPGTPTHYDVLLDGDDESRTLTFHELVKVREDALPANSEAAAARTAHDARVSALLEARTQLV